MRWRSTETTRPATARPRWGLRIPIEEKIKPKRARMDAIKSNKRFVKPYDELELVKAMIIIVKNNKTETIERTKPAIAFPFFCFTVA